MSKNSITSLKSFQKLVKLRAKVTWGLTIFLVFVLFGNVLLMSSWSELGSKPLFENGTITIALAYSIGVVLIGMLTCFFYVWWANSNLDPLIIKVQKSVN